MHNTFWNDKTLIWQKLNGATFKVDDEFSTQHEEEFIIIVVLVPMVLPFALRPGEPPSHLPCKVSDCAIGQLQF
jgi:hypothetical protein